MSTSKEKMAMKHVMLLQDGGSSLPLFIIPGTGGKSNYFLQLAKLLSDNYKVFGINLKGTEPREKPQHHVEEIASLLISWVCQIQPHGPYRFISHCFGGNIAFEMAIQLEKQGESVEFIAILDGEAGRSPGSIGADFSADAMRLIASYFDSFDILKPPYPDWVYDLGKELSDLPVDQMMPHISTILQKRIPSQKDAIRFVTRLIKVNLHHAQIIYTPLGKTNSELYIFKPEGSDGSRDEEALGWENNAEKITIVQVPGDHDTMMQGESARVIADHLSMRYVTPNT
jgi:thioesterase domain-containing protein